MESCLLRTGYYALMPWLPRLRRNWVLDVFEFVSRKTVSRQQTFGGTKTVLGVVCSKRQHTIYPPYASTLTTNLATLFAVLCMAYCRLHPVSLNSTGLLHAGANRSRSQTISL
eukprot:426333-Rhodomonas_salina.2